LDRKEDLMSNDKEARALEVLSHMLRWSLGSLSCAAGPETLSLDESDHLIWSTKMSEGGPVRIRRKLTLRANASLQQLATVATELAEFAERVDLTSRLRTQCEQDVRDAATRLLSDNSLFNVTLVRLVSQPIEHDAYSSGQEVTFDCSGHRTTISASNAEDLHERFHEWLVELTDRDPRLAA
jgi:hypothetical protein